MNCSVGAASGSSATAPLKQRCRVGGCEEDRIDRQQRVDGAHHRILKCRAVETGVAAAYQITLAPSRGGPLTHTKYLSASSENIPTFAGWCPWSEQPTLGIRRCQARR